MVRTDGGERGCTFALLGTDSPEACFSAQPGEEGLGEVLPEQSSWDGVQGNVGMVSSGEDKGLCLSLEGHLVDAPATPALG